MTQGSKTKSTDKQIRPAMHIKKGYEKTSISKDDAEAREYLADVFISPKGFFAPIFV